MISKLYHVPYKLSSLQKLFLLNYFGIKCLIDPHNGDHVAALGDCTGEIALRKLREVLKKSSEGSTLLSERPIISSTSADIVELQKLSPQTFGKSYAEYMSSHSFNADERAGVRFISDSELAYIMLRYRQVHDFWHVLTDLPADILGELALKWLEYKVTGLPVCLFGGVFGSILLDYKERQFMRSVYMPWAEKCAQQCRIGLLTYPYEKNFSKTLDEVRSELRIEPAPRYVGLK
jgi:ubiquinone biosynthesis protein COQ4